MYMSKFTIYQVGGIYKELQKGKFLKAGQGSHKKTKGLFQMSLRRAGTGLDSPHP